MSGIEIRWDGLRPRRPGGVIRRYGLSDIPPRFTASNGGQPAEDIVPLAEAWLLDLWETEGLLPAEPPRVQYTLAVEQEGRHVALFLADFVVPAIPPPGGAVLPARLIWDQQYSGGGDEAPDLVHRLDILLVAEGLLAPGPDGGLSPLLTGQVGAWLGDLRQRAHVVPSTRYGIDLYAATDPRFASPVVIVLGMFAPELIEIEVEA